MEKSLKILKAAQEYATKTRSIYEIMKEYQVSYASIYKAIKKYNIPFISKSGNRKHNFKEDYFENINSQEKAYFLGLICADGSILKSDNKCKSPNRLRLSTVKNTDLLQKLLDALELRNTIKSATTNGFNKKSLYYYIDINSVSLVKSLGKYNCSEYKIDRRLPNLPEDFMPHFIRGYFDGDGTISGKMFEICSHKDILLEIQKLLMEKLNFNVTKLHSYTHTNKAFSLRYGGKNQLKTFYNYIYQDATIYCQYKFEKFTLLVT